MSEICFNRDKFPRLPTHKALIISNKHQIYAKEAPTIASLPDFS